MSNLASLVVDLQLQNAQLKKGLDEATRELADFGRATQKLGEALEHVFSFEVAKKGVEKLADFVREGAVALASEEKSAGRLSAAFGALGYDAKKVAPYFNELAESLEHELLVDGETVRQVEQLLVQFGVAPKDIEKTTRAILDYSAATGKDAVGAAQQLVTSVMSGKDEVRKMGISIQGTGDSMKDMAQATDQISARFGGSAIAATAGFAGQLGRLQKAQEDLGKAFARFFVDSDTGRAVIKALTDAMDGMTYAVSKEHAEEAGAVERTEKLTKLREQLGEAEKRLGLERGRQGTWMASAASLADAKRERDAILEKINLLEAAKIEAGHAQEAEVLRARASEEAAKAEASAQAKALAAEERRKKTEEERKRLLEAIAEVARAGAAAEAAVREKRQAMANIGETRGFSSFDAALEEFAAATVNEAHEREQAKLAEKAKDYATQRSALEMAEQFKRTADEAGKAADAFIRMNEAQEKAIAEIAKAGTAADVDVASRRATMARVGVETPDTRSFESFDAALEQLRAATVNEAYERENARLLEMAKDFEGQRSALEMAEQFKRTADEAGKAADAFIQIDLAAKSAQQAMLAKALGPVQGFVDAGKQGAAAGAVFGPEGAAIGAAVGVGLDLLTQSAQYKQLMDEVTKTIQAVADGLGKLLEPLLPFGALLEPLGAAVGAIAAVLGGVLSPGLELLWDVLKPVVLVVLEVTKIIGEFWNGLVGMLQSLLDALGGINIFGEHPLGFLNDWSKGLEKSKVNLKGVDDAMAALDASTYDSVKAQQDQTDSQKELTDATDKATASMTNVPSGYKVALDRFNAANGDTVRGASGTGALGAPPAAGGSSSSSGAGGPGAGGGANSGGGGPGGGAGGSRSQNLVQVFIDGDEVLHRLQVRQGQQAARQAGRRVPINTRLVGAF